MQYFFIHASLIGLVAVACLAHVFLQSLKGKAPKPSKINRPFALHSEKRHLKEQSDSYSSLQRQRHRNGRSADENKEQLLYYQNLYYKLQNLEYFPEALSSARTELLSLLSEAISAEQVANRGQSILHIETYNKALLERFLTAEHNNILQQWEAYNQRRASGRGPELFTSREAAKDWLKQRAPVKYVDGVWLGHVHKITTPFVLRRITKAAWQVLSEELGDGDLQKHHVYLYRRLLESVGINLPHGYAAEFTNTRHGMLSTWAWKAAVSQLLISLFPNEFLPEILGFNLHYELITLESLKASKELSEFKISGYYFVLHVSIDNADSGHTAMALSTVINYLELIEELGLMDVQVAWRRIQAGYLLSKNIGEDSLGNEELENTTATVTTAREQSSDNDAVGLTTQESDIVNMLLLKANVSRKIHCTSQTRIGQRTLMDWLSRETWRTRREFIDAFADASPWVQRGNSGKSMLIKELSWGGKMFGAFTDAEVRRLRTWIDCLPLSDEDKAYQAYSRAVGRTGSKWPGLSPQPFSDVAVHHPVLPPIPAHWLPEYGAVSHPPSGNRVFTPDSPIKVKELSSISALLALWFSHASLLENSVNVPFKTATQLGTAVIRILRAEYGFPPETAGVAGMDEQRQPSGFSLVDIGLEMARSSQARQSRFAEPTALKDVLLQARNSQAATFAYDMLSLAQRPTEHQGLLMGLARAFLDLEVWVADLHATLELSPGSTEALQKIIVRKSIGFQQVLEELGRMPVELGEFCRGYALGRTGIQIALGG
ncbi:hypothetical protein TCE0_034r12096 [Talaromyces pinophilus]|jgi:hypothetical protein|uniref:Uncharacterized protein n=1 Tax=Talaromyces pinophilus TaxID=128442 RepID=A0A6V8HFP4_TALPI|nr:hypothetical protein TCE0_034r12096 [Talaromyces pinophilus]